MCRVYSIKFTALALGLSEGTIRNLIKRRDLRATRAGNQWRILEEDLQAYIDARANKPSPHEIERLMAQPAGLLVADVHAGMFGGTRVEEGGTRVEEE